MGNLQSVTDSDGAGSATTRDYLYPGYDDAGTWTTANAARPRAIRKINTITAGTTTATENLTYDNAGQMTQRIAPGKTTDYTWTKLGQLATAKTTTSDGSELTRYAYAADGNLLVRTAADESVASIGGMELRTTDDGETVTATRYYTSGATTVAMRTTQGTTATNGKVTFLMGDTQAFTQLAVDTTTGATTRRRYTPFGDERNGTLPTGTDHGFLGKTEDTSTGLSLLGARAYDPELGRFLSPDPLSTPHDPQNLSAYSYSGNDPINYSDPSGLIRLNPDGTQCSDGWTECGPSDNSLGGSGESSDSGGSNVQSGGCDAACLKALQALKNQFKGGLYKALAVELQRYVMALGGNTNPCQEGASVTSGPAAVCADLMGVGSTKDRNGRLGVRPSATQLGLLSALKVPPADRGVAKRGSWSTAKTGVSGSRSPAPTASTGGSPRWCTWRRRRCRCRRSGR
ncbi:RHS repeat-associated protein [Streptomyces canus]|uniref:RHS repeat-associated core domain-containing protein n=1 Tax=Streptomyces canus TaxID=58343 RepID=UPI0027800546|nr:RHS repeat-associated core domain-containing protein [Streptomyces canus]MDQ0595954.1 RHS repeat-associated protein [Streptomyces canus]